MKKNFFLLFAILTISAIYLSCDETAIVGSGILDDESLDYNFNDTTTIHTRTILGRPVNSGRLSANTFMVGALDDPIFGKSTSDVYLGLQVLEQAPIFDGRTFEVIGEVVGQG